MGTLQHLRWNFFKKEFAATVISCLRELQLGCLDCIGVLGLSLMTAIRHG